MDFINPIFQYAIIGSYLKHRPKCPRCGLRNNTNKDSSNGNIKCKRCGYRYNETKAPFK